MWWHHGDGHKVKGMALQRSQDSSFAESQFHNMTTLGTIPTIRTGHPQKALSMKLTVIYPNGKEDKICAYPSAAVERRTKC